jgi:hypothetical protein
MADGVDFLLKGYDQYEVLLGDELRGERATLGKSLLDVQRDLKIKAAYIAAIENCDLKAFSNRGFVAGYVRSYARYLNLHPDLIYERFCSESGFLLIDGAQNFEISKRQNNYTKKNFGERSNWKPNFVGMDNDNKPSFLDVTSKLLPIFCLLGVIFGVSFGAYEVLHDIQKLEIVVGEDAPIITTDNQINLSVSEIESRDFSIYSSKELNFPVFSPRDGPLSELIPEVVTALEDRSFKKNDFLTSSNNVKVVSGVSNTFSTEILKREPIVRTSPKLPNLKLFALTPAWVRLTNVEGIVVFEKILNAGETYSIEKSLFEGTLRAGNATNVYFFMDGEALGPLSEEKSVAKNISLNPEIIKSTWRFSNNVTRVYLSGNSNEVLVDTAKKQN